VFRLHYLPIYRTESNKYRKSLSAGSSADQRACIRLRGQLTVWLRVCASCLPALKLFRFTTLFREWRSNFFNTLSAKGRRVRLTTTTFPLPLSPAVARNLSTDSLYKSYSSIEGAVLIIPEFHVKWEGLCRSAQHSKIPGVRGVRGVRGV